MCARFDFSFPSIFLTLSFSWFTFPLPCSAPVHFSPFAFSAQLREMRERQSETGSTQQRKKVDDKAIDKISDGSETREAFEYFEVFWILPKHTSSHSENMKRSSFILFLIFSGFFVQLAQCATADYYQILVWNFFSFFADAAFLIFRFFFVLSLLLLSFVFQVVLFSCPSFFHEEQDSKRKETKNTREEVRISLSFLLSVLSLSSSVSILPLFLVYHSSRSFILLSLSFWCSFCVVSVTGRESPCN